MVSRAKTVPCGALWYHLLVSASPTKTVKVNYSLHVVHISFLYELSVHEALKSHQCKGRYRVSMAHRTTDKKNPVLWVFLNNDEILSYSRRLGMLTMMFSCLDLKHLLNTHLGPDVWIFQPTQDFHMDVKLLLSWWIFPPSPRRSPQFGSFNQSSSCPCSAAI